MRLGRPLQIAAGDATPAQPPPLPWLPTLSEIDRHSHRGPKAASTPGQILTALAAPGRYRVVLDADGWPMIPGKLGRLEWHDEATLTNVWTESRVERNRSAGRP